MGGREGEGRREGRKEKEREAKERRYTHIHRFTNISFSRTLFQLFRALSSDHSEPNLLYLFLLPGK